MRFIFVLLVSDPFVKDKEEDGSYKTRLIIFEVL